MWPAKPQTRGGTCPGGWWIGGYSLGFERTVVQVGGEPYLGRWILYVGGYTLRLHKFYRGDDQRAFHDHPWPFWTFPLVRGYWEVVPQGLWREVVVCGQERRWVRGWRLNYRPSSYRHIVCDPVKPFWTVVVTGRKDRGWGFWPVGKPFVPWKEWT